MAEPKIKRVNRMACWNVFSVDRSTCSIDQNIPLSYAAGMNTVITTYRVHPGTSHGTDA